MLLLGFVRMQILLSMSFVQNRLHSSSGASQKYTQLCHSASESVTRLIAKLRPREAGLIPIPVNVVGGSAGGTQNDSLVKNLRVTAEGVERVITKTVFLMKEGSQSNSTDLTCEIPEGVDGITVSVSLTVVGDLLGDAVKNMDGLISQPSGCGEQNLARFSSSITVYGYLKATGQLTPEREARIRNYVSIGLNKHETLYRPNQGYSFFPYGSDPGSTFVSAFTVKIYRAARKFTAMSDTLVSRIRSAVEFVASKQESDGGFYETSANIRYHHQGGLYSRVPITAFIAIVFTEAILDNEFMEYTLTRDRAIANIVAKVNKNNAYELAITCYTLHLTKHPAFTANYNALLKLSTENPQQMFWDVSGVRSLSVEASAYALLFIRDIDGARAIKIAHYLISKKTATGGWSSTQDTAVALQALSSVAALVANYKGDLNITAVTDTNKLVATQVNNTNRNELQTFDLDPKTREVEVRLKGVKSGKAVISLTCRYFVDVDNREPRFEVSHRLLGQCNTPLKIEVCMNYIPVGKDQSSNMVLLKMNMPSGYNFDPDTTPASSFVKVSSTFFPFAI